MGDKRAVTKVTDTAEAEAQDDAPVSSQQPSSGVSSSGVSSSSDEPLEVNRVEVRTVITCAIDDIALAALRDRQSERIYCSVCDDAIEDERPATGLMMWTRGDDIRYDEPPLCGPCATSISVSAWTRWLAMSD